MNPRPKTDSNISTWSTPSVYKVDINGQKKNVILMGGGYDDGQDAVGYYEDSVGNAIYMIELETGDVVWSAGDNNTHNLVMNTSSNAEANATMKHSFPAPVTGVDLSGNGYVDRIYAADMGGRIWRFDIFNGASTADKLATGGLLATLGAADLGAPKDLDVRRFYATPSIVPIFAKNEYEKSYLSINIGSGHRAHPLEEDNNDWFFSVRDFDVFSQLNMADYDEPVTFDDLIDITEYDPLVETEMLSSDPGWRLQLQAASGEKVLSSSLTLDGTLFFTTFSPTQPTNSCTEAVHGGGTNRLYRVSVLNGDPAPYDSDDPVDPPGGDPGDPPGGNPGDPPGGDPGDPPKRSEVLDYGGLAPDLTSIIVEDPEPESDEECEDDDGCGGKPGEPVICIGPNCFPSNVSNGYRPTYWFQNETK